MNRRTFLRLSAVTASALAMTPKTAQASTHIPDDYKALVRIHFAGGNDALNTFVPMGTSGNSSYDKYKEGRGDVISIKNNFLDTAFTNDPLNFAGANSPYGTKLDSKSYLNGVYKLPNADIGINAAMPELFDLYTKGAAGIILNIGSLIEPITEENKSTAKKPPFIGAHNHQTSIMSTGESNNITGTGWAGRIADLMASINDSSNLNILGMGISYSGDGAILRGVNNKPITLAANSSAQFEDPMSKSYRPIDTKRKLFWSDLFNASDKSNIFNNYIANVNQKSIELIDVIKTQVDNSYIFSSTDPYGNALFDVPSTTDVGSFGFKGSLIKQLEATAQMIKYSHENGMKRQVYDIKLGGFDFHQTLLTAHPLLLRDISLAVWKFNEAMKEIGLSDNVTLFTTSDFGRTLVSNGNGTGHAWAGSNFMVGGAVNGGEIYGKLPDLTLGGVDDNNTNGRFIPSTSIEQYFATLSKWFGTTEEENLILFPNLSNFSKQNLDFMVKE